MDGDEEEIVQNRLRALDLPRYSGTTYCVGTLRYVQYMHQVPRYLGRYISMYRLPIGYYVWYIASRRIS